MSLAAGTISLVSKTENSAVLTSAVATGGTGPYTYQWYRSAVSPVVPGGGTILAGKTALSLTDLTLSPNTQYYYLVVATDSIPDTANSNEQGVLTNMSLTAGTLSQVSVGSTIASLLATAATLGTAPYTYQWYRSIATGFTPGGGNIISGATALALNDTGLIPNTQYYYKVVATDSAGSPATVEYTQLAVATSAPVLNPNSFAQSVIVGMIDMRFPYNTISAQIDTSQATSLYAGAAVKIVDSADGVPKVIGCAANSDEVFGFINYDIKTVAFVAGSLCEISQAGNVMYLYAIAAIARGVQVQLDLSTNGGVKTKTGSSGADIVGWALDKAAAAGALIRVHLTVPSFAKA